MWFVDGKDAEFLDGAPAGSIDVARGLAGSGGRCRRSRRCSNGRPWASPWWTNRCGSSTPTRSSCRCTAWQHVTTSGARCSEVVPPAYAATVEPHVAEVLTTGAVHRDVETRADVGNATKQLLLNLFPLCDHDDEVIAAVIAVQDLTTSHEVAELEGLRLHAEWTDRLDRTQRAGGTGSWEIDLRTGRSRVVGQPLPHRRCHPLPEHPRRSSRARAPRRPRSGPSVLHRPHRAHTDTGRRVPAVHARRPSRRALRRSPSQSRTPPEPWSHCAVCASTAPLGEPPRPTRARPWCERTR